MSLACLWGSTAAQAEQKLDLALVLAVDVSSSMTKEEQELQRLGFIEAFQSPSVHKAIAKGSLGRIAVVYVEWSGADDQIVLVPWTGIEGAFLHGGERRQSDRPAVQSGSAETCKSLSAGKEDFSAEWDVLV